MPAGILQTQLQQFKQGLKTVSLQGTKMRASRRLISLEHKPYPEITIHGLQEQTYQSCTHGLGPCGENWQI